MIVDGKIRCSACTEWKALSEYSPGRVRRGCGECRPCEAEAQKRRRMRRGDAYRAARRAHYRAHPAAFRAYNLKRYSLTPEQYEARLAAQGGGCACCGVRANRTGKRLFVDHDHATGAVRGIVCHLCNAGIGALGDTVEGVRQALAYLERAGSAALDNKPQIPDSVVASRRPPFMEQ